MLLLTLSLLLNDKDCMDRAEEDNSNCIDRADQIQPLAEGQKPACTLCSGHNEPSQFSRAACWDLSHRSCQAQLEP